jgi:hypothetical protein
MNLDKQLRKINNFKPEDRYSFLLTSPTAEENPIATGHIHPEIAEALKEAGHVAIDHTNRVVELTYNAGETDVDAKLWKLQEALIAAQYIPANHPDQSELVDVIPTHGNQVNLLYSVAKCPRNLAPFVGLWRKSSMVIAHDVVNGEHGAYIAELMPATPVALLPPLKIKTKERKANYDVPGGTGQAGDTFDDIAQHEFLAEFGVDLKAAPLHKRIDDVKISRKDKDDRGSNHRVMAVYTFDMAEAKRQGLISADFVPFSSEPGKIKGWKFYPAKDALALLEQKGSLVHGKAWALALAMHELGMHTIPDEKLAVVTGGMNGSVMRGLAASGIQIHEGPRGEAGRPKFPAQPNPASSQYTL